MPKLPSYSAHRIRFAIPLTFYASRFTFSSHNLQPLKLPPQHRFTLRPKPLLQHRGIDAAEIDLELEIDLFAAARSDKVMDTVSYDKVVECASKAFSAQRFRLIEAAAGRVADAVLTAFPRVNAITVTIHKPHAPIASTFSDVGVTLVRKRTASRS